MPLEAVAWQGEASPTGGKMLEAAWAAGTWVDGGIGVTIVFWRGRVDAGMELDVAMPTAVAAHRGDDPSGGGGRLNDDGERRRLVARWGDFAVMTRRKGTAARLAFAVAKPGMAADRHGGG